MAIEWKEPLRASKDQDMHMACHVSVVVPTGLFASNEWRDNLTAIGRK